MGQGNGMGIARRFGREGFVIAMVARSDDKLRQYQKKLQKEDIESYYYLADVAKPQEIQDSLAYIHESLGPTKVLVYNPAAAREMDLLQVSEEELTADLQINVIGAVTVVQTVKSVMEKAGGGKILITGGGFALEPTPAYASLALGKAALRNLTFSLHQQLKPFNIHVATVTICGHIGGEDEKYTTAAIAEQYWALYQQEAGEQQSEIIY